jgi:cystathionine beta-lyase
MIYDFDTVIPRRGTGSLKYDFAAQRGKPPGLLPLWVADMDFTAPPEVLADLQRAVEHGIFGYSEPDVAYFTALCAWFGERFDFYFAPQDVVKTPGVVFALALCVRAFTERGDAVLIQPPVYHPFFEVIRDNGRVVTENPLIPTPDGYKMDFAQMEESIRTQHVKLFLLCSPHNPVGRVWTRQELARVREICRKYGVVVVSDEIHCDFVWNGGRHTCYAALDEDAIIATSTAKTFNLAGMQVSNIIVKNIAYREMLQRQLDAAGYSQLSTLGLVATRSAYAKGAPWLAALKNYLEANINFAQDFLSTHLPQIRFIRPEATYLLWLDFRAYEQDDRVLGRRVTQDAKLWLSRGSQFGTQGAGFQRLNAGCPRSVLQNALERLHGAF